MKQLLVSLAIALFAVGCGGSEDTPTIEDLYIIDGTAVICLPPVQIGGIPIDGPPYIWQACVWKDVVIGHKVMCFVDVQFTRPDFESAWTVLHVSTSGDSCNHFE